MCLTSVRKKEKKLWSLVWEELQNSPADFASLRFVTFISWEVIKDNCWHLWRSRTAFIFKYFTEKPRSYRMRGMALARELVSFLSEFNNSWGGARIFICCFMCFTVFWNVCWFQLGQAASLLCISAKVPQFIHQSRSAVLWQVEICSLSACWLSFSWLPMEFVGMGGHTSWHLMTKHTLDVFMFVNTSTVQRSLWSTPFGLLLCTELGKGSLLLLLLQAPFMNWNTMTV